MKLIGSSSNNKGKRINESGSARAAKPRVREPATVYAAASAADSGVARVPADSRGNVAGKAKKPADKPAKKPVSRAKRRVKVAVIILLVLVICAGGLLVGLGFYVDSVDTIFPNVWAEGVDLSGLTLGEATRRLIDAGYENNADGISVTIVFPDDTGFSVSGNEAGLSLDAREAAAIVFNFGRDGSIIENARTYVRSRLEPTELYDLLTTSVDDTVIRERSAEYTGAFNDTLMGSEMEVTDSQIKIIKGTGFLPVEESSVFDLAMFTLARAIEENEHLTVNYLPQTYIDESIDLAALHNEIHVEPVSSEFTVEIIEDSDETAGPNGRRGLNMGGTESTIGRSFDLAEAEEMLGNAASGDTIIIPIVNSYPEFTQEEVYDMILRDVLGEMTSTIGGPGDRVHNINIASQFINETILLPGEVFSFNQIVGPRRRDRGFRDANALEGGVLVQMPGGGICQVSSTIYAALLRTAIIGQGIDIVERRPHGLTVSYLPFGQDATVAWGSIDFRFRNSLDFPIKIETIVEGRNMNVRIIGSKFDDNFIEVEMVQISVTQPYVLDRDDPERPYGERYLERPGQPGRVVETFQKLFSADGELISRTLVVRDVYNRQDRITLVGTYVSDEPDWGEQQTHGSPSSGTDLAPDYNPYG